MIESEAKDEWIHDSQVSSGEDSQHEHDSPELYCYKKSLYYLSHVCCSFSLYVTSAWPHQL